MTQREDKEIKQPENVSESFSTILLRLVSWSWLQVMLLRYILMRIKNLQYYQYNNWFIPYLAFCIYC